MAQFGSGGYEVVSRSWARRGGAIAASPEGRVRLRRARGGLRPLPGGDAPPGRTAPHRRRPPAALARHLARAV